MIRSTRVLPRILVAALMACAGVGFSDHKASIYKRAVLKNGLEVIVFESPKVPLVTIALTFRAGAMTETKDLNGLTHLWEHMFFKGNKKIPNEQLFERRTRQLGMISNAFTGISTITFHANMPSAFMQGGLELFADAIKSPLLAQKDLEHEKQVVLDEYDREASSPSFGTRTLIRYITYGDQQFRRTPLGDRKIIETVTREKLLRIKNDVFVPSNAALFIGGDIELAKALPEIEKYFGDWLTPKNKIVTEFPPMPAFPATTTLISTHKETQNVSIAYSFAGPSTSGNDKLRMTSVLIGQILDQRNGQFYKQFIDSGMSLGAGLDVSLFPNAPGTISLSGDAVPQKAKQLEKALLDEVQKMSRPDYFKDSQLVDMRRAIEITYKEMANRPSEFTMTLSSLWSNGGLSYFDHYLEILKQITKNDLAEFVKTYLLGKPYLKVVFLNPTDAKVAGYVPNAQNLAAKYNLTLETE